MDVNTMSNNGVFCALSGLFGTKSPQPANVRIGGLVAVSVPAYAGCEAYFLRASRTLGATCVPKISIAFIMSLCDGPPTSMCAAKRVNPNISCT